MVPKLQPFLCPPPVFWSDHYQTIQHLRHGLRTNPTAANYQSAQATANAIASALTARTASISLPIYDWDLKDAYHSFSIFRCTLENWLLLNCVTSDSEDHLRYVFAALGTKSLEMHAQWMPTGSEEEESNQGKSFCLPWPNPAGNDTRCQHPCAPQRTWRYCGQAGRGPPRFHCTHQDTDGPLWDDQLWALQAWAALLYHPCILSQGKAPWETYGKTI